MPVDSPVNQQRELATGEVVQRYHIIGTDIICYEAFRPIPDGASWAEAHAISTTQTVDEHGRLLGAIGCSPFPDSLNDLPAFSEERYQAVDAWHTANEDAAHAVILAAYPEAVDGCPNSTRIERNVPGTGQQARVENWQHCSPEHRAIEQNHHCPACGTFKYRARGRRCADCRKAGYTAIP